jgi:hypothetical protein
LAFMQAGELRKQNSLSSIMKGANGTFQPNG